MGFNSTHYSTLGTKKAKTKYLNRFTGGLSKATKMPCLTYNLPPSRCLVGSILSKVEGSVCSGCYAKKGRFVFPRTRQSMERRYDLAKWDTPAWTGAITEQIRLNERSGFFRWHSSGDLFGRRHFEAIVDVANQLPDIKFWLPTHEREILMKFIKDKSQKIPQNLIVRLSSNFIDKPVKNSNGFLTCTVHKDNPPVGFECPALRQNYVCGECRVCWDGDVKNVGYKFH